MSDPERVGFFEESKHVKSSTRLFAAWLLVLATALVAALITYLFVAHDPSATVLGALTGALGAVVAQGAVAIIKRNDGTS